MKTSLFLAALLIFSSETISYSKEKLVLKVVDDSLTMTSLHPSISIFPKDLDTVHDFNMVAECWVLYTPTTVAEDVSRKYDWTVSGDGMIFTDGNTTDSRCAARFTSAGTYTMRVNMRDRYTKKVIAFDSTRITIRQK